MMKKGDDYDDDDGNDGKNFFREVCSVDCPGSTGWLSARGTFTRWVLSRTRRWLLFLSLILSRARLFYPANLFKRAFNSARPCVPPVVAVLQPAPLSRIIKFFAQHSDTDDDDDDTLFREFNVGNNRQGSGRAESERLSPHPDRLSDPSYTVCLPSASFSSFRESEPSTSSGLPRPRRRTTRRSRGFPSSAREIRVLLLRFSRTRVSYRGMFLSSSSSSSSSSCPLSPSPSWSVSLFLRCPFPFRVSLSVCLSPFSSACCNPFCETSCARTRRRGKSERAVDREPREKERERQVKFAREYRVESFHRGGATQLMMTTTIMMIMMIMMMMTMIMTAL